MKLDLSNVKTIGTRLVRPEGVMVADECTIYTADGRGQFARIEKDGKYKILMTEADGKRMGSPNFPSGTIRSHFLI